MVRTSGTNSQVLDALASQRAGGANAVHRVDLISEVAVTLPDTFMSAVGNRSRLTTATSIGLGEFALEENETIRPGSDDVDLCGTRFSKQIA